MDENRMEGNAPGGAAMDAIAAGGTAAQKPAVAAAWLDGLQSALAAADLGAEGTELVRFYEEYWMDALESGREPEAVAEALGAPEGAVAQARSERSILAAERKPGPVALLEAARRTAQATGSIAGRAAIGLAALLPLLAGLVLYVAGLCFIALAPVAAVLMALEMPSVPVARLDVQNGLFGLALAVGCLALGLGWALWKGGNGLTRLTMKMLRRALKRAGEAASEGTAETASTPSPAAAPSTESASVPVDARAARAAKRALRRAARRPGRARRIVARIGALLLAAGFLLGSGLLVETSLGAQYLSVWMAQDPHRLDTVLSYDATDATRIRIDAMNSRVVVEPSAGTQVEVVMGTPDWMEPYIDETGGVLRIAEVPNGLLPFFRYLAIHYGVTEIHVLVPAGTTLQSLDITAVGSPVRILVPVDVLTIHTVTGPIELAADLYPTTPPGVHSGSGGIRRLEPVGALS